MAYTVAQLSDLHVGGPSAGSGERLSQAISGINQMTRRPDLVVLTGDLTHDARPDEWAEVVRRLDDLSVPWEAIRGNHDVAIAELVGHRVVDAGPLRLVLMDSSSGVFTVDDAAWLERTLTDRPDERTVIAIHHPPFETGIWWMDCVGLAGAERFEQTVRRHTQVEQVLSGHVHRPIHTSWGSCSLWVCPSTSVTIAADLDPDHQPAETAEGPLFSLHAYTDRGIVSHLVPVGPHGERSPIDEPDFVRWARGVQAERASATFD